MIEGKVTQGALDASGSQAEQKEDKKINWEIRLKPLSKYEIYMCPEMWMLSAFFKLNSSKTEQISVLSRGSDWEGVTFTTQ